MATIADEAGTDNFTATTTENRRNRRRSNNTASIGVIIKAKEFFKTITPYVLLGVLLFFAYATGNYALLLSSMGWTAVVLVFLALLCSQGEIEIPNTVISTIFFLIAGWQVFGSASAPGPVGISIAQGKINTIYLADKDFDYSPPSV